MKSLDCSGFHRSRLEVQQEQQNYQWQIQQLQYELQQAQTAGETEEMEDVPSHAGTAEPEGALFCVMRSQRDFFCISSFVLLFARAFSGDTIIIIVF